MDSEVISECFPHGKLKIIQYEPSMDVRQLGDPLYSYLLSWTINGITGSESYKSLPKAVKAYNTIKKLLKGIKNDI